MQFIEIIPFTFSLPNIPAATHCNVSIVLSKFVDLKLKKGRFQAMLFQTIKTKMHY